MSVPENAAGELRAVMPAELVARIDWRTLKREPGSFADEVGESRTDLLFSVKLDADDAYVYVLFEHQSTPDPAMLPRLLIYLGRIWSAVGEERGPNAALPVIVPVVLHHGAGGWRYARRLGDRLEWGARTRELLEPFVPDFEAIVDDLAHVPEMELLRRDATPVTKLVLWAFWVVRFGFDPATVDAWAEELNRAVRAGRRAAVEHVLAYLVGTKEGAAPVEALKRARLSEGAREVVMTLAEQWKAEGRLEGRREGQAEGRAEGRAEMVLRVMRLRFEEVSEADERRVREASAEELDRWIERVLTAERVADVFG